MSRINPRRSLLLGVLLALVFIAHTRLAAAEGSGDGRRLLGQVGYLIIETARDSTSGFTWTHDDGSGRRHLIWREGSLSVPDSMSLDAFSSRDLGVVVGAALAGSGATGDLIFADGTYQVSEQLRLADGIVEMHLSGGELEIRGNQLRYRVAEKPRVRDPRAGYMMLAGMVILIMVLMRRARRHR